MLKILFPVDLSSPSFRIVPKVLEMAEKFEAEIHLLAAAESFERFTAFHVPHPSLGGLEKDMALDVTRKLEGFQQDHLPDYPNIQLAVRVGDPAEQILRYIRSAQIDIVVMATQGRKGLSRAIFGSVAEKVVRNSPVPVMTANLAAEVDKWEITGTLPPSSAEILSRQN